MKRILLFLLPAFFALQAYSFSDINQYQYKTEIEFIKDQGVVEGYEDGSYRPDQLINRAEFTKIILESVQTQDMEGQKGCFPDVKDQWFARYVCTAKNLAVVKGYDNGEFRPANNVNYAEALKIIYETYGITTQKASGQWYMRYLNHSLENDLALGDGYGDAGKQITRGEMARMIYTFMRQKEEEENIADLTGCLSYFDGCNTCTIQDGELRACTLMHCEEKEAPKCLKYIGEEDALTFLQCIKEDGEMHNTYPLTCTFEEKKYEEIIDKGTKNKT